MKKEIHPKYHPKAKIVCTCGNVMTVGSTVPEMRVEVCSKCHPFYTGKQKLIDASGRLERYKKILAKKESMTKEKAVKMTRKNIKKEKK